MSRPDVLRALRESLERDPRNAALWLHYAELAEQDGEVELALSALRSAAELADARAQALPRLVRLLRESGQLSEALIRAESALEQSEDPALRRELELVHEARGSAEARANDPPPQAAAVGPDDDAPAEDWAAQFDWGDLRVTFDDVAGARRGQAPDPAAHPGAVPAAGDLRGLRARRRRRAAPVRAARLRQDLRRAGDGRRAGSALRLGLDPRGPRQVLRGDGEADPRAVREPPALEARPCCSSTSSTPSGRRAGAATRSSGSRWPTRCSPRWTASAAATRDVLICAATNLPWNVDVAFRRPGRFDRILFVPPPDSEARASLLRSHMDRLPGGKTST